MHRDRSSTRSLVCRRVGPTRTNPRRQPRSTICNRIPRTICRTGSRHEITQREYLRTGGLFRPVKPWQAHLASVLAFERTPPHPYRASQRRWASGRSHDQFRTNTNVWCTLIGRDLADKEFRRCRTHLLQRLANGRQRRVCDTRELDVVESQKRNVFRHFVACFP